MAANPVFIGTGVSKTARIATANLLRDGTGTLGTVWTVGTSGGRLEAIRVQAEGTTTAGIVRIFIQKAGAGNNELIKEIMVAAVTPSASIEAWSDWWIPPVPIPLENGDIVKAGTNAAETFSVWAMGGDM